MPHSPGALKAKWCGNEHLNFTYVEQEGMVAMDILLLSLVPSEKEQKGNHIALNTVSRRRR